MIEQLYLEQAAARPLSEARDYALLAAQVNLGGHKIDEARCVAAIAAEMALPAKSIPQEALYERLEGGLCRLNLRPARARGLTARAIAALHMDYLNRFTPDEAQFRRDLRTLRNMCTHDELPLDGVYAAFYLDNLGRRDAARLRHSEKYIAAYAPAYRVAFVTGVKKAIEALGE